MNHWYIRMSIILILIGMLTGCLGNRDWEYPPGTPGKFLDLKASHSFPSHVLVLPFNDLRGNEVQEGYWKAAIPLVPYGETIYERPEKIKLPEQVDEVHFDPSRDFAKATASELQEAGIFSSVTFAETLGSSSPDLVLHGRIHSTKWERAITTYLLGPLGPVFWILGLPMGETTTMVEMDLSLTSPEDPSNVIWGMSMEFEGKQLDGPYYGLKDAVQSYPEAIQDALKPAILNLTQLAVKHPDRFTP